MLNLYITCLLWSKILDNDSKAALAQPVAYAIKVKAELDERVSAHVQALKYLEGGYSKKRWIQEAIKEKLQTYENLEFAKAKCDRTLNFSISQHIHDEVDKIIKTLKKLKIKTSKTDFFIEAVIEKLNREEQNTRKLFQDMLRMTTKP